MSAVVCLWLCLFVIFVPNQPVLGRQTESLWSFREPGNIVLHGLYPIRKRSNSGNGFELSYEGIAWTGAMIHRIQQINQDRSLPGNLTLGYSIRDTGSDVNTGLRQTLAALNEILNTEGGKENVREHIPIVFGPATDELEDASKHLYKLFRVPRISYTTTSSRFSYNDKVIRAVPSDIIHIEALLRLLNDMKTLEFSAVVAKSNPWEERMNVFQAALKDTSKSPKSRAKLKEIIYVNTVDVSVMHQRLTSEVIIIFAESNISSSLIPQKGEGRKDRIWIEVCLFDDPLLRVFDRFGLIKKVIVRNLRTTDVDQYRREIAETFDNAGKLVRLNWLKSVFENHCARLEQSSGDNESCFNETCVGFREWVIGNHNKFNSSLTLQGIIDGVNLVIASLRDTLEQCDSTTPRQCLKLSGSTLFKKLNRGALTSNTSYSIQVLKRVKQMSGRRTKTPPDWTFKKKCEWRVSKSGIQDKLNKYCANSALPNDVIDAIRPLCNQINITNSSNNTRDNCTHCGEATNQSNCIPDNIVINWIDTWSIALYFLVCLCLLAVLSTFVYFSQHKNSPIMILCYSWPDNIILAVLCIFSVLPMVHMGEMTSYRCTILWPIVNIVFAFYVGLLLTRTLFVQNLLKCEVATERPGRRMIFATVVTLTQIIILAGLCIFDFPNTTHLACSSRGTVTLCNIEGNIGILVSIAFNWLLMCALFGLSVTETIKQRQNFCRTENLVAVATVTWLSYTCLAALGYFNIRVEHFLVVVLIQCVIYLVNSAVCLGLIYAPTLRLVSTWLRQHTRQKKNLTSIKRAQVMSSKRQTSVPMRDSLFGANFSNEHLASPSGRHSGYYFDLRPSSAVTDFSYPTSLVRSVHEHTHVVFGYGRRGVGTMSLNGATSVESVPSVDWLAAPSEAHSASSSYDNLSRAAEEAADELSPQELLHEISTYWERHRSSDVIANGQHEDNIETNKWPSLENLRTSDL